MSPPLLCKLRKHFFSHLQGRGGKREREYDKDYMKPFKKKYSSKKLVMGHCNSYDNSISGMCITISRLNAEFITACFYLKFATIFMESTLDCKEIPTRKVGF